MGRDVFGEVVSKQVRQVLLHLSSGRGGVGKGLRSTGLALQLAYQNGGWALPRAPPVCAPLQGRT